MYSGIVGGGTNRGEGRMSVIPFPSEIHRFSRAGIGPAMVLILPVVHIERHEDSSHGHRQADSSRQAQEELRHALGELNRANKRVARSLKLHTYVPACAGRPDGGSDGTGSTR